MSEKAVDTSIILAPGEGKGTAPGGLRKIKIKITGESTGGRYSIVEDTVPPHYATELHVPETLTKPSMSSKALCGSSWARTRSRHPQARSFSYLEASTMRS